MASTTASDDAVRDAVAHYRQNPRNMPRSAPGRSSGANVQTVQRALEAASALFIPENGRGARVRLANPKEGKNRPSPISPRRQQ